MQNKTQTTEMHLNSTNYCCIPQYAGGRLLHSLKTIGDCQTLGQLDSTLAASECVYRLFSSA
jgi:hypothetical protein